MVARNVNEEKFFGVVMTPDGEVTVTSGKYDEIKYDPKLHQPIMNTQVGGSHYTDMPIQPIEYIFANDIPFAEGNIIKYVSRYRNKNGLEDLKKARHMLNLLIEHWELEGKKIDIEDLIKIAPYPPLVPGVCTPILNPLGDQL